MKILVCMKQVPQKDAPLKLNESGTWIREENEMLEKALISGVVHQREETVYRVDGVSAATLFSALADASVNSGVGFS